MRTIRKTDVNAFDRRAFTLAELLIVVAIIAVLVGISIPIFTAQREKSAEAADIANMRAAKAAAVAMYYNDIHDSNTAAAYGFRWWQDQDGTNTNMYAIYDADTGAFYSKPSGKLETWGLTQDNAYGKGTATKAGADYTGYYDNFDYTKSFIVVTIYYDCSSTQAKNIIKQFNGGAYYKNKKYDGKYTDNDMKNIGIIIIEWRNYDGKYLNNNQRKYGEIIFLEP